MCHHNQDRRGVALPLMAIMMVVLMGMAAFVVDIGYIAKSREELQTSADAAALAGAMQLMNQSMLQPSYNYNTWSIIGAVQAAAQQFSLLNPAAGVNIKLGANASNSTTGDIVCAYLSNPRDPNGKLDTKTTPYNAVQVTARRDTQLNGSLDLFFGRVLGMNQADLTVTATAVYDGNIQGFQITPNTPQTSKLLPFTLDVNTWNATIAGAGLDAYSYNRANNSVSSGSDGIKEIVIFPLDLASGNFGSVNLGQSNNGTSTMERQILYGPNKQDFDNMGGKIALGADGTLTLTGNPGVSAGFKDALESIIGQPRVIPLYQGVPQGNGANTQYNIVGFAGIIITDVHLTGSPKSLTIQPQFVLDPTAFTGGPVTTNRFVYPGLQLAR